MQNLIPAPFLNSNFQDAFVKRTVIHVHLGYL